MKSHSKQHRHYAAQQLRNPVFTGRLAKEVKQEAILRAMENDPWYSLNMGLLQMSYRVGRCARHIYRNVGDRLKRIAHDRAVKSVNHGQTARFA
jgi:hypothetical protein